MITDKPFWETDINPITGYKIEAWNYNDERTLQIKNRWTPDECIIVNENTI